MTLRLVQKFETVTGDNRRVWGDDIHFKITNPTNGKWLHFDLEVSHYGMTRWFRNIKDDTRWWKRLYHRIFTR